jgi:hypothetical protein
MGEIEKGALRVAREFLSLGREWNFMCECKKLVVL